MALSEALGFLASGLVLLTFGMRTMLPMRVLASLSNLAFIAYGLALGLTPVWVLHGLLLPLNLYRLRECQQRARRPESEAPSASGQPVVSRRRFARGDILFHQGDFAHDMFYILKGRVRLRDLDGTLGPGDPLADLSLSAPGRKRPATAVCETDCELLVVSDTPCYLRPEPLSPAPAEPRRPVAADWLPWLGRAKQLIASSLADLGSGICRPQVALPVSVTGWPDRSPPPARTSRRSGS